MALMTPEIHHLTRRYAMLSAAVSVITHPVPGVDELVIVPIHYCFSIRMAKMQGVEIWDVPWRRVHKIVWGGALLRFGSDIALGFVPIAGAVTHGLTAAALTRFLGHYLYRALTQEEPAPPVTMRAIKESIQQGITSAKSSLASRSWRESWSLASWRARVVP
ncbi:hypothetical protein [Sorangium sp. So ce131]|uniref:hypothetical protein n=1 Tax=Sorangium sp. So ce131 TaxID=3133282 RepID=UPI003F61823F